MSFLSLPDKFISRSVCKKWFCAAREVLKEEDELVLSMYKLPERSKLNRMNAMHFLREPNSAAVAPVQSASPDSNTKPEDMLKLLFHLKNLEKITVTYDMAAEDVVWFPNPGPQMMRVKFRPIVDLVIASNSHSLVSLIREQDCLPSDTSGSVVFVRLKELRCRLMTEQDICRCPRLRKLTVRHTDSLQHLQIDTMQELVLMTASVSPEFVQPQDDVMSDMNHLIQVVSRLTNLKVLRICRSFEEFPDEMSSFKKKLIQNLRKLEVVSLCFERSKDEADGEFDENQFVELLVQTNPNIRVIDDLYLTERGIRSLCSLKHLKYITELRVSSSDRIIPSVMAVLTGNSGHCLETLEVSMRYSEENWNAVEAGVPFVDSPVVTGLRRKLQEAGLPFEVTKYDDYNMNVTRIE
jgi:hypothetical protein